LTGKQLVRSGAACSSDAHVAPLRKNDGESAFAGAISSLGGRVSRYRTGNLQAEAFRNAFLDTPFAVCMDFGRKRNR